MIISYNILKSEFRKRNTLANVASATEDILHVDCIAAFNTIVKVVRDSKGKYKDVIWNIDGVDYAIPGYLIQEHIDADLEEKVGDYIKIYRKQD
jgi:DNA-directed RNA polymerase subunit H (RpoH/RPB5)